MAQLLNIQVHYGVGFLCTQFRRDSMLFLNIIEGGLFCRHKYNCCTHIITRKTVAAFLEAKLGTSTYFLVEQCMYKANHVTLWYTLVRTSNNLLQVTMSIVICVLSYFIFVVVCTGTN